MFYYLMFVTSNVLPGFYYNDGNLNFFYKETKNIPVEHMNKNVPNEQINQGAAKSEDSKGLSNDLKDSANINDKNVVNSDPNMDIYNGANNLEETKKNEEQKEEENTSNSPSKGFSSLNVCRKGKFVNPRFCKKSVFGRGKNRKSIYKSKPQ